MKKNAELVMSEHVNLAGVAIGNNFVKNIK